MQWTQSEVIALAHFKCPMCHGAGLSADGPCDCVARAIFKACFSRFRACVMKDKHASAVKLERLGMGAGRASHMSFGRKTEEYIADFYLLCQRTLTAEEWDVFRFHYLLGAAASMVARRFNMTRAAFETMAQAIESKLGRAFRETEPFALYPLDEYFGTVIRGGVVKPCAPLEPLTRPQPLCPPLRPAFVDAV